MKMIQVQKLTQEAFAPFGEVLTTEGREAGGNPASHLWYPQAVVIDGPTSINLMRVLPHDFILKDFEAHDHTTENLIAMDGDLIVGMAPAGALEADNVKAFYIPRGLGISLKPGKYCRNGCRHNIADRYAACPQHVDVHNHNHAK